MNEIEIVEKINKLQKEINSLKQQLNDSSNERWVPIYGQDYYAIDTCGRVEFNINNNNCYDECAIDFRNCFRTQEEAETEAEKILIRRQLEDIAKRLNKGKKIDWEDENQEKYCLIFDYMENKICRYASCVVRSDISYCLDENFCDIAIQEIGEERLKKYLRSNE